MQSDAEIRAQYPEYFLTYYTYLRIIRNPARIEHVFQKAHDMYRYLEAEGKDVLDGFVTAMTQIQQEAEQEPERVTSAPHTMPVRRLDDVRAAKQLDLRWKPTA